MGIGRQDLDRLIEITKLSFSMLKVCNKGWQKGKIFSGDYFSNVDFCMEMNLKEEGIFIQEV